MEAFLVQHIHYRGALLYLLNSFNVSLFFIICILTLKPSIIHVFPLFNTRKFQIMHCLQDGIQQSAELIDLVDAFNSSLASYLPI